MNAEQFWFLMTVACLVWYSTVTLYVAVRGAFDIRSMLNQLRRHQVGTTHMDPKSARPGT